MELSPYSGRLSRNLVGVGEHRCFLSQDLRAVALLYLGSMDNSSLPL